MNDGSVCEDGEPHSSYGINVQQHENGRYTAFCFQCNRDITARSIYGEWVLAANVIKEEPW